MVWAWDLLLCGFFAAVSRPPPVASFSLCDLRLFVIKRIYLSKSLYRRLRARACLCERHPGAVSNGPRVGP